jgi:hypothetical protein
MNEFTLDELKRICQFFNIAIEDFNEPDSTYELRDKIQLMIDNYCEHNNSGEGYNCTECRDCGVRW